MVGGFLGGGSEVKNNNDNAGEGVWRQTRTQKRRSMNEKGGGEERERK